MLLSRSSSTGNYEFNTNRLHERVRLFVGLVSLVSFMPGLYALLIYSIQLSQNVFDFLNLLLVHIFSAYVKYAYVLAYVIRSSYAVKRMQFRKNFFILFQNWYAFYFSFLCVPKLDRRVSFDYGLVARLLAWSPTTPLTLQCRNLTLNIAKQFVW